MKIAVTGGSGFIGSAVVQAVKNAGHDPLIVDRTLGEDYDITRGGLNNVDADHVIHLAGVLGTSELFDTPHEAIDINIHGAVHVLEYCQRWKIGYTAVTLPPIFHSVYTVTKVCADGFATAWHEAFGVPVSTVRAYNVFGVGQKWGPGHPQKFLPTFATRAWMNLPLQIWGDGEQTMDVVSTTDLARMLVDATRFGDDDLFEAGCGMEISVNDFAQFVLEVTGSTAGVEHLPMRKGEIPSRIKATGIGWDKLDWRPTLDWDEVAEAIYWYKDKV